MKRVTQILLLVAGPVFAGEREFIIPDDALTGIGKYSCENFIDWIERDDPEAVPISWVFGFWSALNILELSNERPARNLNSGVALEVSAVRAVLLGRCYEQRDRRLMHIANEVYMTLPFVSNAENNTGETQ